MKKRFILTLFGLLASVVITLAAPAPPVFQLRLVLDKPSADSETMTRTSQSEGNSFKEVLNVQKTVLLDETALKSAEASTNALTQPIVNVKLTDAGAKKFADITRQNIHKRVAIIIDGRLLQAPVVHSEISGGDIQISGSFTDQETKDLAKKISDAAGKK